jgi:hypothetical protein
MVLIDNFGDGDEIVFYCDEFWSQNKFRIRFVNDLEVRIIGNMVLWWTLKSNKLGFGFVNHLEDTTTCNEVMWWIFKPRKSWIWVCEWFGRWGNK